MIKLETEIEGKRDYFGKVKDTFKQYGYVLGGNWEYDRGYFDATLWREGGETIYIRLPFTVIDGQLDDDLAYIEFRTPYVIKHVVNIGLDREGSSLLTATGFSQFQEPLDKDAHIEKKSKWEDVGEQAVQQVVGYLDS